MYLNLVQSSFLFYDTECSYNSFHAAVVKYSFRKKSLKETFYGTFFPDRKMRLTVVVVDGLENTSPSLKWKFA